MKEISKRNLTLYISPLEEGFKHLEQKLRDAKFAVKQLNDEIRSHNESIEDARDYMEDLIARAKIYISHQNDEWLFSPEGQEYKVWIAKMQSIYDQLNKESLVEDIKVQFTDGSELLQNHEKAV